MSELVQNLSQIYNIKLQIKDVLGTDSDLFEEYPDLIEEAIGEGGSATPVDPWYNGTSVSGMIDNEESSADYVSTAISGNFSVTLDSNDELVEAVEWDEIFNVEENNESVEKTVHVIVNGDPHEQFGEAETIAQAIEDYPDLEDEMIFPILENATLTASEDPSNDGYDYLLEGDLYAWNLNDCFGSVQEITENGFHSNDACLGYNINVPSGGVTPGKYYFFNWLSRNNPNAGTITLNNPLKAQFYIVNLDELNYMDEGEETHNSYFNISLYEDSAMTTEVEFDDISDAFVDDNSIQFNLFKDLTNNDTIKYVKAEYYVWESDIDPETGIDSGSFELDDTFTGAFTNSYTITSNDEVVMSVQIQNGVPVVAIYINGIGMGDGAILSVV